MCFPTVPNAIPIPQRLILFSPHPDDVSISIERRNAVLFQVSWR
jgi:hypothetical protein